MKAEILRRSLKQVIYDLQETHENTLKNYPDFPTRFASITNQRTILSNFLIWIAEIKKISDDDESVDCGEYLDIIQLENLIKEYLFLLDSQMY